MTVECSKLNSSLSTTRKSRCEEPSGEAVRELQTRLGDRLSVLGSRKSEFAGVLITDESV